MKFKSAWGESRTDATGRHGNAACWLHGSATILTLISDVRLDDEEAETPLSLTVEAAVATIMGLGSPPLLLFAVAFINLVIILLTTLELLLVSRYSSVILGSCNPI